MAESIFCGEAGAPLARYPHAKRVGNLLYLSGLSARQPDNSVRGVIHTDTGVQCDVKEQTEGIVEKYAFPLWYLIEFDSMKRILANVGADLGSVVDLTVFLKDMKHYADFNEVSISFEILTL